MLLYYIDEHSITFFGEEDKITLHIYIYINYVYVDNKIENVHEVWHRSVFESQWTPFLFFKAQYTWSDHTDLTKANNRWNVMFYGANMILFFLYLFVFEFSMSCCMRSIRDIWPQTFVLVWLDVQYHCDDHHTPHDPQGMICVAMTSRC